MYVADSKAGPKRTISDWYSDRMREAAQQDPEAESPYGEHWQKLMRGHSKTDLINALKSALQRVEFFRQGELSAEEQNERLRANLATATKGWAACGGIVRLKEDEIGRLREGEQAADAEIERLRAENAALLESCKNLRRAAMFAYNLTSGQGAWYDESNEVEDESNAGVFLTIVRAEEEKLGILL